jgi:hypothetical protein
VRFPQDISCGSRYILTGCWDLSRNRSGGYKPLAGGRKWQHPAPGLLPRFSTSGTVLSCVVKSARQKAQ